MKKKILLRILSFLTVSFLIAVCSFSVFAYPDPGETPEADEPYRPDKPKAPCLKKVDSASSKAEITTFGGMELDSGLRMILTDVIRQLKAQDYNLGFIMVDIKSGKGIAYDPDRVFYSASTIKGFYVASMTYFYPESFEYYADTIESVLVYSDNSNYEYLWGTYGTYCIKKWAEMAGVKDVDLSELYTEYSARDLAKLWLLNYAYFESKSVPKSLPKLYETPEINRIHAVLGSKYRTRSKAGWIPTYYDVPTYDDGGIVYDGDSPYVIAFLSDIPEESMNKADGIIRVFDIIHRMMAKDG